MEFLDDIRQQQESRKVSPTVKTANDASEQKQDLDTDPWNDLLADVAYDEPTVKASAPGRGSRRSQRRNPKRRKGMSTVQKAVLGGLMLAVVLVWGGILLVVTGSLPLDISASLQASGMETTPDSEEAGMEVPAVLTGTQSLSPTAPPEVTVTPTAGPAVFTRFDRRIEQDPSNVELYLRRGREYLSMEAYQAARGDFEKALALDATSSEGYVGLGWANYYLWRWEEAEQAFEATLDHNPNAIEAYFGLGHVNYQQGRYKQAAAAFDQAAEINPLDAEAEAWLAISAAHLGDIREAQDAAARALARNDSLAIAYIAQSWARRIQTPPDIDGAQADLLYAEGLAPNTFQSLNALAEFYISFRPERLIEAEQLAHYAHNWAVNDIERALALQTLGRIYLAQGRNADAHDALDKAVTLATVDGQTMLTGLAEDLARAQE